MLFYDQVEEIALDRKDDKGMAIVLSNKGIIQKLLNFSLGLRAKF